MGFNTAMLLLCSYCDPVRTLAHAKNEGYSVVDYRVTDLPFGAYSSEPKVLPISFLLAVRQMLNYVAVMYVTCRALCMITL